MPRTTMGGANSGNRRTALILAGVALAFFFGIMLRYWLAK